MNTYPSHPHSDSYPGDEPYIVGESIDQSWRYAWARCVSWVWNIERKYQEASDSDKQWYEDMFSKDPEKVLNALIKAGFVIDGFEGSNDDANVMDARKKWVNTHIVVKRDDEKVFVGKDSNESKEISGSSEVEEWKPYYKKDKPRNGWIECQNALKFTLVLHIPKAPKDPNDYALALADLQAAGHMYPFTPCC